MPLLIFLLFAKLAFSQHGEAQPVKIVPREWPGYGELRFTVTSSATEAKKWANQGLRMVYAFNHPEAVASFEKAIEIDPQCAMCWWGLGFALGSNINSPLMPENALPAFEAAAKAESLAGSATEREKAYIDALVKRYAKVNPAADRPALDHAYAMQMRTLAHGFPDDLDAQTLYADALMNLTPWKLWTRDGKPARYSEEIVSLLEDVLRRDPEHMGANHLYIHAVEASSTPERALPSAGRLGRLAPASGHLVHMPAHVYMRVGDYEEAARLNALAAELDRKYFETVGGPSYYLPYWAHNLHFLSAARSMQGRYADSRAAIHATARQLEPLARMVPAFESSLAMPILLEVRFQQWETILAMEEPASFSLSVRNVWLFARGMAQAGRGGGAEATKSLEAFRDSVEKLAVDRTFGLNQEKAVMRIAVHLLEAKIAFAGGAKDRAIAALRQAVEAEDALSYDEPADWYYPPSREALGAVLLSAGQAAEAETVFRSELENNRRSGRALFGLREALRAQEKADRAEMVDALFQVAWRYALQPLTIAALF